MRNLTIAYGASLGGAMRTGRSDFPQSSTVSIVWNCGMNHYLLFFLFELTSPLNIGWGPMLTKEYTYTHETRTSERPTIDLLQPCERRKVAS